MQWVVLNVAVRGTDQVAWRAVGGSGPTPNNLGFLVYDYYY